MVTRTSGRAATTASAAWCIRRIRWKYFGSTSARPITDSSCIGNRLSSPSACIAGPPIAGEADTGSSVFSPAISAAAQPVARGSPAIRNTFHGSAQSASPAASPRASGLVAVQHHARCRPRWRCPAGPPPRPAATVSGPIAGMSTRRSWPGFGRLTSTPPCPVRGSGDELQQRRGALDRLDPEAEPAGDDRRLADVERPERVKDRPAARRRRSGRCPRARRRAGRRARSGPASARRRRGRQGRPLRRPR